MRSIASPQVQWRTLERITRVSDFTLQGTGTGKHRVMVMVMMDIVILQETRFFQFVQLILNEFISYVLA